MKRDIKFRFWIEKEKKMCDWEVAKKECDRLSLLSLEGFIPMQYTGLKDRNGKEIYEGDILMALQKEQGSNDGIKIKDIVIWHKGGFECFSRPLQSGYTHDNYDLYKFMWCSFGSINRRNEYYQIDEIELVGNIHENIDLLKI